MNKILLLIIPISLLLTGCYDYKEINSIAIASATEITKENGEYITTIQAINPQAPNKTTVTQAPFVIYSEKGKTLQEAYRKISLKSSRFIYSSHLQLLIINEELAKEDITEIIDFYIRNPSIRTEFYVAIGKDKNILKVITPIDEISSASIKESIETNTKYLGSVSKVTFNEFVNMTINPNLEIVLPTIELIEKEEKSTGEKIENTEDTEPKNYYKLTGLAFFKNNKLKGYLTTEESRNYNIITNNIKNTIITYECQKDKYLTTEITSSKSNIDISNNFINISIKLTGNLNESLCHYELKKESTIDKIENEINTHLEKELTNNINKMKDKYNIDAYGFLDNIYKHDYKTYKKIKASWYTDTYKNYKVNVSVDTELVEKGNSMEKINEKS